MLELGVNNGFFLYSWGFLVRNAGRFSGIQGNALLAMMKALFLIIFFALLARSRGADPIETQVLSSFLKGLSNGDVLGWGGGGDACGWKHIRCRGQSIIGIGVENLNLQGTLTPDINKLANLEYLGLQFNSFHGPLPSLSGLKNLQVVYLNSNGFSSIPSDFFHGLENLQHIYLDHNLLNTSSPISGWELPPDVESSTRLVNLSLTNTSLTGKIPDFLGRMSALRVLNLAYNSLRGNLPDSFSGSGLTQLEVNNMALGGPIDVVGKMPGLSQLWLQVNQFTGEIPEGISNALALRDLRLNNNKLKGLLPNLTSLPLSQVSFVDNNLMGPIPALPGINQDAFSGNKFCQSIPGRECPPQVTSILGFLSGVGFPDSVIGSWAGSDPCTGLIGVSCDRENLVVGINFPSSQLSGTISPAIGALASLRSIVLSNNNLTGQIPQEIGTLPVLQKLDLSNNNLQAPMITFSHNLSVNVDGNPLLNSGAPGSIPAPPKRSENPSPGVDIPAPQPRRNDSSEVSGPSGGAGAGDSPGSGSKKSLPVAVKVAVPVAGALSLAAGLLIFFLCCRRKGKGRSSRSGSSGMLVHPRNSTSDPETVKVSISRGPEIKNSNNNNSGPSGRSALGSGDVHVVEAGNLVISIQVLRQATRDFHQETILGRGGFGVVYKGVLDDGTSIAVKRMEASTVVSSKGLSEFQAEIAVLTKVRHRHLVALLGYCIEGNEKLLVYEYLPNGTLAQHLFERRGEPGFRALDWKRRLVIALDVARGMEYLHGLAHMSFIHRDLKPSNILLDDDFRAKVSDFGLVKLAPEGKFSVETRLAGTFGYLAPEYAVTGRVTTKADVFSFGVVLMELITGRRALDETQPEENMHLVSWFRRRNQGKESFAEMIDPAVEAGDDKLESIHTVAELARHCTAREPYNRPDMGHAVNVLAPLVDRWRPAELEGEESKGIDLNLTLPQALKQWQASDDDLKEASNLYDSQSSLPTRPVGFADSFTSSDAR